MESEDRHAVVEVPPAAPKYATGGLATLTWQRLGVTTKDVKGNARAILKEVSGYVCPRDMLAIMGPSGCGKTTLLDTLAGRLANGVTKSGTVLLNGHKSRLTYGVSAYVTQDEVLVGTLSVRETLLYAALLRLPAKMAYADKVGRVDDTIAELGLGSAQHTKIGTVFIKGISGGQKRRVAIGCELITHPTLLFLDEPTSGLDAASAFNVMRTIRQLAEHDRTIVTVIHQPSSEVYELFDKLCLLSGGQVVYMGKASSALEMFEAAGLPCPPQRNPTDHFLHAINRDFASDGDGSSHVEKQIQALLSTYEKTIAPGVMQAVEELSQPGEEYRCLTCTANPVYQTGVLTVRMLVNNLRDIAVFGLRLGMFVMLCLCIGTIYFNLGRSWQETYSRAALLFFAVAFLTFMSIAGFPAFQEDMKVFMRERLNGYYSVATFALANTIASAPFIFAIAIISSCIIYWLAALNDDGDRFPYFFTNLFLSLTVVESLMMMIAAVVPHYLMGIAGGAGIMGMYMLVCGFFQPTQLLPAPVWLYPLHYMGYHTYSFFGFMRNEFEGTDGWLCPCYAQAAGCGPAYATAPCTVTGEEVLSYWSIDGLNKWADVGILAAMVFIYRTCFWAVLVAKERYKF